MKNLLIVLSILSLFFGLNSCSRNKEEAIPLVSKIDFKDRTGTDEYVVYIGKESRVNVDVYPYDVNANRHVKFTSSDLSLFTVDDRGYLKGIGVGVGELIVEATDGSGLRVISKVNVKPILINELKVVNADNGNIKVTVFKSVEIKVGILPEDATVKKYKMESSDESVFTIDNTNKDEILLKGMKLGKAVLTLTSLDGSNLIETYEVNVEGVYEPLSRIGWTASAISIFNDSYPADKVLDGVPANFWNARTELPAWIIVDMKSVKDLDRILCESRYTNGVYHTKTIDVYVSNKNVNNISHDDDSFVKVGTSIFGTSVSDYIHAQNINIIPTIKGRYIKVVVVESNVRYSTTNRYEMSLSNIQPYILTR